MNLILLTICTSSLSLCICDIQSLYVTSSHYMWQPVIICDNRSLYVTTGHYVWQPVTICDNQSLYVTPTSHYIWQPVIPCQINTLRHHIWHCYISTKSCTLCQTWQMNVCKMPVVHWNYVLSYWYFRILLWCWSYLLYKA
jgi:hypothetical protein